jgi:hypothetical protein
MRFAVTCLCAAAAAAMFMTSDDLSAQQNLLARAKALHGQAPLIDGHNDYPWALRGRLDPGTRPREGRHHEEACRRSLTDIRACAPADSAGSSGRSTCLRCRPRKP